MVGQLQMARGNSVAALDALHEALDLAADLDESEIRAQAADVLVRVYQIRARYVPGADQQFLDDTLDRAHGTLDHLEELGLEKQVAMLNDVIARLVV
jgi:hypothetical protein